MLLLHTCCAPCSAAIIEKLLSLEERFALFFFNPNIFPQDEYLLRRDECMRYAAGLGIEMIDGEYDHDFWLSFVAGHETEPERGSRCLLCFKLRLLRVAQLAKERGFTHFATTLAASRWKSLEQIAKAGHWAASETGDVLFLEKNWRKGGLEERRRSLLLENAFYNQNWCGCEFSRRSGT